MTVFAQLGMDQSELVIGHGGAVALLTVELALPVR